MADIVMADDGIRFDGATPALGPWAAPRPRLSRWRRPWHGAATG